MDIKESDILKEEVFSHWYYKLKADSLINLIGDSRYSSVTDIGAGSGFFSKKLLSANIVQKAICVDIGYENESITIWDEKELRYEKKIDTIEGGIVLMMDVLEHIEDDRSFLKSYIDLAPLGTKFFITVPAFQFMFSPHDIFLEHFRRYNLSQLNLLTEKSGLKIISSNYFYATLFPIVLFIRLLKNLKLKVSGDTRITSELSKHSPLVNSILYNLHKPELLLQKFNHLYGLSIMQLSEKI